MQPVELSKLTDNECMYFEPLFFEDSKSLDYNIADNISILGDAKKLKDLISILLENALKYSVSHTSLTLYKQKIMSFSLWKMTSQKRFQKKILKAYSKGFTDLMNPTQAPATVWDFLLQRK